MDQMDILEISLLITIIFGIIMKTMINYQIMKLKKIEKNKLMNLNQDIKFIFL